jgi:hypothetical protein
MTTRPSPIFPVGQAVRVILNDRNKTPYSGKIRAAFWHHKDQRFNYYLEEDSKKVSKRYLAEDLEAIASEPDNGR